MKEFLKKNWFVIVVAMFFVAVSIWYFYDQNKDNLPGKQVDGKDVVFSVDEKNYTADDIYDELYESYGKDKLVLLFRDAVVSNTIKTTPSLITQAEDIVDNYVSYYTTYYGYGKAYLDQIAKYSYGYSDFTEYVIASLKNQLFLNDYINEHKDTIITNDFIEEFKPRIISYCLIKFDDPANPTDEENEALKKAQDAWESDKYSASNFAEFAKEFSEDTSTAPEGGLLGYTDKNSSLVEAFLNAALELEEGEVSEWVFDENYGYFLIKCDSTKYEDMQGDSSLLSAVEEFYPGFSSKIILEKVEEYGYSFQDEELKTYILDMIQKEANPTEKENESEEQ